MKVRLIVVQYRQSYPGELRPNVVDLWDETALEENWDGYEANLRGYQQGVPNDYEWVNLIDVVIPDEAIDALAPKPVPVITLEVVKKAQDGPQLINGFAYNARVRHNITGSEGHVVAVNNKGGGDTFVNWDDSIAVACQSENLREI